MPSFPKVSVLIPTYNYAHFLDETIQSVLDQTFTDFELIIVDNCSTDNTDAVVKKYLTDNRVFYHKNETNLGLVGNWNKCLEYATGEYIKYLCADDKFYPQILEKLVAVLDRHPDVSIVCSNAEIFGERSSIRILPFKEKVSARQIREVLLGSRNKLGNPSAVMFRKADVQKVGTFNPQLIKLTDREYYLRLLTLGDCYVVPEPLVYIRSHPNTQSARLRTMKHELIFERYRFITSVSAASTPEAGAGRSEIDARIKKGAVRSAAVMYEVLPKIYKKESRKLFKKAYQIGHSEGVLFTPIFHYLKWEYMKKLIGANK